MVRSQNGSETPIPDIPHIPRLLSGAQAPSRVTEKMGRGRAAVDVGRRCFSPGQSGVPEVEYLAKVVKHM